MSQLNIFQEPASVVINNTNQTLNADLPIHRWYQFVLGYPPHLVQHYLEKFEITRKQIVLDPFCGTGTTNVECFKQGIPNYGIEGNTMACFASRVKTTIHLDIEDLRDSLGYIDHSLRASFDHLHTKDPLPLSAPIPTTKASYILDVVPQLSAEQDALIPQGFISPKPLQKILIAKEILKTISDDALRSFFSCPDNSKRSRKSLML